MPWCPECGAEYREGFARCSDCDVDLVGEQPAVEPPPADDEWVTVAAFSTDEEARLAHGFLTGQGIHAQILDKQTHVGPYGQGVLAEVELEVPYTDAERALELLDEAEENPLSEEELAADEAAAELADPGTVEE